MIKKYFTKNINNNAQAIIYMILASFWFSVMATLIRYISKDIHPFQMIFCRNVFCILCLIPWATKHGIRNLKPKKWNLYFLRVASGIVGMMMFFYTLAKLPMSHVISLTYLVPLITTILATIILKEKITIHISISLLIGFCGILVIIRPGIEIINPLSILPILVSFTWSVSNIIVKKLSDNDHPKTIILISMFMMLPLSTPLSYPFWSPLSIRDILFLLALGWSTNNGQIYMSKAYSISEIKLILPFDFARIIFVSIFAYLLFGEKLDNWALIGSAIIISSPLYLMTKTKTKLLKSI